MRNLSALERELDAKREEGLALLKATAEKADAENRAYTDDERAAIEKISADGRAIQAQIARGRGDDAMLAEISRLTSGVAPLPTRAAGARRLSLGEQFVTSPEYEFFKKGGHRASSSWRSPGFELVDHGPMATILSSDPVSGAALVVPQYVSGIIPLGTPRTVVADLAAPGTTDTNAVNFMREKTYTNAAAAVAEGLQKPESALIFEAATAPVRKIAHWLPVTEEMLEDVAQLRSYIDARLRIGVQIEEEDELLNGVGVAPHILGYRMQTGLAADVTRADPDTNADAMLMQTMAIFGASFLMPTGYVLNPANWTATILAKNLNGDYIAQGGPFSPIQSPTMWGLPVAITPAQPIGEGLVGAFSTASQVFRRGGIRVEASNSHADFFIKNLVAIRAEERLALAVYRPAAFGKVLALTGGPVIP